MQTTLAVIVGLLVVIIGHLWSINQRILRMHKTLFRLFMFGSRKGEAEAVSDTYLLKPDFKIEWCEAAGIKYKEIDKSSPQYQYWQQYWREKFNKKRESKSDDK